MIFENEYQFLIEVMKVAREAARELAAEIVSIPYRGNESSFPTRRGGRSKSYQFLIEVMKDDITRKFALGTVSGINSL